MEFLLKLFKKDNQEACCSVKFEVVQDNNQDCCDVKIEEIKTENETNASTCC